MASAAQNLPRDRDLLQSDDFLTDPMLDNLWDWFCNAANKSIDPQLVFVKLINSARKPYNDALRLRLGAFFGQMGGRTSYTPTERTVVDEFEFPNTSDRASVQELQEALANAKKELGAKEDRIYELTNRIQELERLRAGDHKALEDQKPKIQEVEKVKARDHKALEEQTSQLQSKLDKLAAKHRQSLNEVTELKNYKDTISSTLVPTRVAIKSVAFERRYVSMNSAGVKSFSEGGGGTVDVEMTVHEREIFELERHPDDVVAFRGSCFPNVYIRADACGLGPGDFSWVGGGKVNFQYSCGEREKFRIHRAGDQGEVAIESVAFPGRYLRLDGLMQDAITLQGKLNWWEKFYLIFAP